MGFQQGLSGISSASKQLDVVGNNVANSSTSGFKGSRTEFADMYAAGFYGVSGTQTGIGAQTAAVSQLFVQGNISPTGNSLDMAISGNGLFVVKSTADTGGNGTLLYTRNGSCQVDRDGYIVNGGDRLQGWPATNGAVVQGPVADLQLETGLISPQATSAVDWELNLDSRQDVPSVATFDPANPLSFNSSTAATVYDSLGNTHNLTLYFVKSAPTATGIDWTAYAYADGSPVAAPSTATLNFDTQGQLTTTTPFSVAFTPSPVNGSITPVSLDLRFDGSTQFGAAFGVNQLEVDGYPPGSLTGINIDKVGIIQASYSNGQTRTIGQVALATFQNQQGLQSVGGSRWAETFGSGPVQLNAPLSSSVGEIQSSALEESNVDMTEELVNMIVAQRFYQANAQTIKTQDAILQTLINLR
ncbi:MAG: flagellar hook protein FlgE [Pseudogulbenkiania sp.]|nr:flagellar hook protein FlgE [Pseudogulbenkiania sp.]